MEPNEIAVVVKEELAAVETTLRAHVSDEVASKFVETNASLGEIRTQLNQLMERGESPADEKVKTLEAKLVQQETAFREFTMRAQAVQMSDAQRVKASDEALFRGQFLKDTDELKKRLREMRIVGVDARAIDSTLFATGGKLNPETADRFIDYLIEKQVALSRVSVRRMMGPQGNTDVLAVSRRKIRKAVEGVDPELADAIATRRRILNTVEVIWAEDLTLTFLEDNIERRGAEVHIGQMLARQFGNDLNDLGWNGSEDQDSSGDDGFVGINDGWIKLAEDDAQVNDLDASTLSTPTNTEILNATFRKLPVEFKGLPTLNYFVPVPFAERYAEEVSTRETPLGDQMLVNGFPMLRYFGHSVVPESHLWEENEDKLVLTPPENLYFGIQRQLMIDSEWRPRKRAIEFTLTARADYEYSTGLAIVLVDNIPAANR